MQEKRQGLKEKTFQISRKLNKIILQNLKMATPISTIKYFIE
jgi:hypothetical protein